MCFSYSLCCDTKEYLFVRYISDYLPAVSLISNPFWSLPKRTLWLTKLGCSLTTAVLREDGNRLVWRGPFTVVQMFLAIQQNSALSNEHEHMKLNILEGLRSAAEKEWHDCAGRFRLEALAIAHLNDSFSCKTFKTH